MYTLSLKRLSEHKDIQKPNVEKIEDSTIGEVILTDSEGKELFKCYCCENIGPSTDTPNQDKRIIPRTYQLEWTSSSKNGSLAKKYPEFKLKDGRNKAIHVVTEELPSFANRRILIHVGNYPQDTEGCLLFGYNTVNGIVSNSIECIKDFFKIVEKIGISNITLEIKEIGWN